MITMEDWASIRRLAGEGVPHAAIARRLGISRTTVVKAVASTSPPVYVRRPSETSFVVVEPRVKALLAATPDMPATVLAERVGWTGSITWFRENVARLRSEQRRIDPADRLEWEAGDAAQCDLWFPPRKIPLEDAAACLLPVPDHRRTGARHRGFHACTAEGGGIAPGTSTPPSPPVGVMLRCGKFVFNMNQRGWS